MDPKYPDAGPRPEEAAAAPRVFDGRFRAERLLKRGHSMETLYGVDLAGGGPVVIKAVAADRIPPAVRIRLEQEADILRKIDSPMLAPLLAVGQRDGLFFMVTRYQSGTALEALLRQRQLTVTETLAVARSLLAALAEAHRHGVLHRDVKPANVILPATGPVERAALVDFGLAHSSQWDVGISEPSLASVRYLSPEQAGMLGAEVSACSDLYAAGVVLYECLAGRTPFAGDTVGEVLRQHITLAPADLRSLGLEVPRALDEILQRLLHKDPRDRYQTAAGVLADVEALMRGQQSGQADPPLVIGLHDHRQTLTEPAFVGRDEELAALETELRKARHGRGGLVLVESESGGGKTRLLEELCRRCARQSVWVLRGHAQDQVGQHPFLALEGVAGEILAACRADPQRAVGIREGLGDRLDAVVAVLPKLTEVLGGSPSQVLGPESVGEARTIEALVTFLAALGSPRRPALIILDDCQWADEPTLKLLRRWLSRRKIDRHTPSHAVLICAFRTEEVREGHILRNLSPSLPLRLPPFKEEDTRRLAESMAGSLPEEALKVVVSLSDGSPFMASAVLRGMFESRALLAERQGWRVERSAMDDVRSSRHAAELLARRINLLPRVAVELLKVAAVLGKEFDLNLAVSLVGLLPGHALVAVRQAQNRHLVWLRADDGKYVFIHDKVRETCLALLDPEERRELHLRAASLLEQQAPAPNFELAYHYDMAGRKGQALPYALAAAEQARKQYSLEIAEQQYRIALRGSGEADQETRYRIAEGLGDVLMLRGRYDPARQMFEAAKFLAQGDVPRTKAKIEGKLGELARKRGDKTARYSLERALSLLQLPVPKTRWAFFRHLVKEVFVQVLHTLFPQIFVVRRTAEEESPQVEAARLYGSLGHVYWFAAGKNPCLWSHLRHLNLAERYAGPGELAVAYAEHGPAMSLVPFFGRAIRYLEESLRIRRQLGDIWGQGQSLNYYGFVLYAAARLPECIDKCQEAARLHERTGDFWQIHMARYQIAASLYRLGKLPQAVEEAKRLHLSGVDLGDTQASGISLDIWAWASSGKVPEESLQRELAVEREDAQATAQVLVAEAVRLLLGLDEPQQAVAVLEQARQVVKAGGVGNAYVVPVWAWLATALRRQIERTPAYAPGQIRALQGRYAAVIREGLQRARKFPNDLPHLLREEAMLKAMQGRPQAARRILDKSIRLAEQFDFRYDRELAVELRGRLGLELGWPGAADEVARAEAALGNMRLGIGEDEDSSDSYSGQITVSLVDQFGILLETGRRIASALSADAVFLAACEAALKLLRAEECRVVRISSDGTVENGEVVSLCNPPTVQHELSTNGKPSAPRNDNLASAGVASARAAGNRPPELDPADRRLLRRAMTARETVIARPDEAPVGRTSDTAVERSALCAPVFERGRPTVCLLVTHRRIARLFGDNEVHMADFIAAIAGAALENAAGFAGLQQLNETLEQRVAERTAELAARTDELTRSNRDLEQFACVASHDLQEPLRTVAGYCKLLEERCRGQLDDKARQYVTEAVEAARRMRSLIDDLLAYSRAGRQRVPFEPTDCNAVLDQALRNLGVVIEETRATIERRPLPQVMADSSQLLQVFQNLIENAIKFRDRDRTPRIQIAADPGEAEWIFSIRDNGIGMRPEDLGRVFNLFQRLHSRDEYPGTGIGLAVCKKTIERHGGRIWAESRIGEGSVFSFVLPAVEPGLVRDRGC